MRRVTLLFLMLSIVAGAHAAAQVKPVPDFSGTWTRESADAPPNAWGVTPTITQTATSITVVWTDPGSTEDRWTYNFVGGTLNPVLKGNGQPTGEMISTQVSWDGNKLVLKTLQTTQVISIEDGKLVMEISAPGRRGGPYVTKVVYKRKF